MLISSWRTLIKYWGVLIKLMNIRKVSEKGFFLRDKSWVWWHTQPRLPQEEEEVPLMLGTVHAFNHSTRRQRRAHLCESGLHREFQETSKGDIMRPCLKKNKKRRRRRRGGGGRQETADRQE